MTNAAYASFDALDPEAPLDYRELAVVLVNYWRQHGHTVVGLGGGQGAGKSTLASLIQQGAHTLGERVAVLALDDFYLTKTERDRLAQDVHRLFSTRGPPGTHAIDELINAVVELKSGHVVDVPQFDKGLDDRTGTLRMEPHCDRVIIEGWCVGATPQPDCELAEPLNQLERDRDQDGIWRRAINAKLMGEYAKFLELLDSFVFLRVPDIESVRSWRLQQEQGVPTAQRKDAVWVDEFVQYYQRLTEWMWLDAPLRADVVVELDAGHRIATLVLR